MERKTLTKKHVKYISTKAFAIPILFFVTFILVFIVLVIVDINGSSNKVFELMERSRAYQLDATSMQASNTVMSETCNNYVLMPLKDDNSSNFNVLIVYANELNSDRRSPKVAERFRGYDVNEEVLNCVLKASEYSEMIKNTQIHAISLMASVYPLPPIPVLSVFSSENLTAEELAMNSAEREAYAKNLILESDYAQLRYHVNENIDRCNSILHDDFSKATEQYSQHIMGMRVVLWVSISIIVLTLSSAIVLLHFYIFKPLRAYSKQISANKSIKKSGKILEMNQLVDAFNGLWNYRNKLETILRTEAENDSLTGLPNRYCMERDLLREDNNEKSFTLLMFDVNFLKRTNDTQGHLAGDNLIRTAGACIRECFGLENQNNCYRIGGDEFVALMFDVDENEIKRRVDKFKLALVRENISVSVGYAHSEVFDSKNFKSMMEEADKNMYDHKKKVHEIADL